MNFTLNQKWIPATVVLAVTVGLIFAGKIDAEKASAWAGSLLIALGLEGRSGE